LVHFMAPSLFELSQSMEGSEKLQPIILNISFGNTSWS
jgi:hypothetical protein